MAHLPDIEFAGEDSVPGMQFPSYGHAELAHHPQIFNAEHVPQEMIFPHTSATSMVVVVTVVVVVVVVVGVVVVVVVEVVVVEVVVVLVVLVVEEEVDIVDTVVVVEVVVEVGLLRHSSLFVNVVSVEMFRFFVVGAQLYQDHKLLFPTLHSFMLV